MLATRRAATLTSHYYFADYLEKNFKEAGQSPVIQRLKCVYSKEELKALEASVAGMLETICSRPQGHKIDASQLYTLQHFCRQVGYQIPSPLAKRLALWSKAFPE